MTGSVLPQEARMPGGVLGREARIPDLARTASNAATSTRVVPRL